MNTNGSIGKKIGLNWVIIIKGLILAAGYATRLYPLTKNKPKALLEVGGKTILDHIVEKLEQVPDVDEILVITNNKFSLDFEQWVNEKKSSKKIKIINDSTLSEEDRLGAVGDIEFAVMEQKINDNLLVVAGDNLFEYSLKKFADYFEEKKSTLVACKKFPSKQELAGNYGVVELDSQNRVIGFEEKPQNPKTQIGATGCYIFTKQDLQTILVFLKEGNSPDNPGDFIKYLSEKKHVFGFVFSEKWFDIGSFEALGKAREEFNGK